MQVLDAPRQVPQVAQSDGSIEIKSIKITGLERLKEDVVLTGLTLKQGDVLVGNIAAKLNEATNALDETGWFRDRPSLSLEDAPGGAELVVAVLENPLYHGTKFTGNTLFSTERLMQEIEGKPGTDGVVTGAKLVQGEVINMRKLFAAMDGVVSVYHNAGYIAAGIATHSIGLVGEEEGRLEIAIAEGLIDEVIVTGLESTKENVVNSQITHLRSGSVLMQDDLYRDIGQIYNTGLFESVTPELEPSLKEGYVKVVITVAETTTGQAGFGLGYSTLNGLQGSVSYNEKNLFGTGKQLGAMVTFSRNQPSIDLNFADPYFTDNSFWNVGVFSTHSLLQRNVNTAYESEMKVDTKGASVGYGQHLNDYDTWQTTFGVTDYDYRIRKGDPFYGYTPQSRARLSESGQTRKLGLSFTHDERDNVFSTTKGYMGKVTGEIAGFGGDFNFNKWTAEGREFYPAGHGTLGFRQRLGMANGDVPIYEEYSYGGVNSIRGLSEDIITGTHSLLLNSEYRYPINKTFGVVGFLDSGWAGESFSGMDHAMGAGIGARIKLKMLGLGAVRLDYGWELAGEQGSGSRFHFFLGEMF